MTENARKVAIVTGGARGIGAGVAERLSADGLSVAIVDLDATAAAERAAAINALGGTAASFTADVSDEDSVSSAVAAVAEQLGAPTVLVNNAGVLRDNLLFKMSASDWDTVLGVHLKGAFLMSRAVQTHMVEARWGRVVSLSSTSALGNRGQANYSAAKAGIQGLTKTLAIELGQFGVTANAIAPGFIDTDMTIATAARLGVSYDEFKAGIADQTPVRRVGVPADIAAAVSFFVREEAGYVSGQTLYVAGGPTV